LDDDATCADHRVAHGVKHAFAERRQEGRTVADGRRVRLPPAKKARFASFPGDEHVPRWYARDAVEKRP
jgi:hypothetical protein